MKASDITTLPEQYQRLKLAEIAERIREHLKRFEADPKINKTIERQGMKLPPWYYTGASYSGNRVYVWYVIFQGNCSLTKSQAIRYLAALDNGFVGQHFQLEAELQKGKVNQQL
jgi:hypothetical protein